MGRTRIAQSGESLPQIHQISMVSLLTLLAIAAIPDLELDRHQGAWVVLRFEREGKETPADLLTSITRFVEGDHVMWKREGKSFAGTRLEIDASKSPATIDLIPDGGPARGERVLGIYRFEDDGRLTICIADRGEPRPPDFTSPPGSKRTLQVFRRR
jgi:uncharacterized protein (TIGR03067 family)